ncbi:MAG: type I secretion system permease/ATPase [Cellvibrionaceae bacterium]
MDAKEPDGLLESLLYVSRYHGTPTTPHALLAGLPLQDNRLTPSLYIRASSRVGLTSKILSKSLAKLHRSLLPTVLLLDDEQVCILVGWSETSDHAKVVYPELSEAVVEIPTDTLEKSYSGTAILSQPEFRFDDRAPTIKHGKNEHWFWKAFRANLPIYRDVLLAAFFVNIFALSLPLFTMNVYDRVVPNFAVETLWMLAAGVAIIILMDLLLKTMRGYFLDLASKRLDIKLSSQIMERVLGIRMESRPLSVGSFASNLRAFETIRDFITSMSMVVVIDLPFALIFLGVVAWIAPVMAIPMFIAMVVIVSYGLLVRGKMEELTETTYRASALRNATLVESLVGLETLKAMGAESIMQRRWEKTAAFLARVGVQQRLVALSNSNIGGGVQQLTSVAIIITGVYLIAKGELSMGGLIACSMLCSRGLSPLGQASGLLLQYHNARTAMNSLDEIMEMPLERPDDANFLSRKNLRGDIEFKDVCFSYPGQEISALNNVSFKIKAGERVAVLGRIGSGKTTLEKLILGIFQPTSGAVLIDGIDSRQLNPAELRQQVGYVPQDITLFYGTLRENLVLAHPQADDFAVVQAAEIANLNEFVNAHPQGFDMLIGERGDSLSGGQRKAVGLARAVIHDPPILLMDEPTGSMDHSTEAHVKKKLDEYSRGKTLLVITHRTALLDMVDKIIVVDSGQVVANGPKDSVVDALRNGRIGKVS